jgi:hypothetical protein
MLSLLSRGESIYRALDADVASIKQCRHEAALYAKSLDAIDQRLLKISANQHYSLFKAQQNLRECGVCRPSARRHCELANSQLDKAMVDLLPPVMAARQG